MATDSDFYHRFDGATRREEATMNIGQKVTVRFNGSYYTGEVTAISPRGSSVTVAYRTQGGEPREKKLKVYPSFDALARATSGGACAEIPAATPSRSEVYA